MYFQIYVDKNHEWRWRLKGGNHEIIAHGEGYTTKQNCLHAINLVKNTTSNTLVYES